MLDKKLIYIIAEIGVNHNGNIDIAKEMICKSKESGANAVKFQTYITDNICDKDVDKACYQKISSKNETQYEMLKKYELSYQEFMELKDYATKQNIDFLTTASDVDTLKFITKDLKLDTIKIGSSDLTNIQLLIHAGRTKKNIILSTGMSNLKDIDIALSAICYGYSSSSYTFDSTNDRYLYLKYKRYIKQKITILHCTTEYPAPIEELNLNALIVLRERYDAKIGYSDHSNNTLTPLLAAAMGVSMIEVHVTKDQLMDGPDHRCSLNFNEFKKYNERIRESEIILGSKNKYPTVSENSNKPLIMKRLFFKVDIKKNTTIKDSHLASKRSKSGILSSNYTKVINRIVTKDFNKNAKVNSKYIK
tara:strand:- start:772 stop:1860 length:1089 start_codon:yes stop_codon:yes gene_type:complete